MPQLKILKNVVDKMKNLSNCLVSAIGSEKRERSGSVVECLT